MNRFDFVDWELTVETFNYTSMDQVKQASLVVVRCTVCAAPKQITFKSIRERTPGKLYRPICKTCQTKETWLDAGYRANQTSRQSSAMKLVWQDDDYRRNIADKVRHNSTENWKNQDFRNKIVAGVKRAHAEISGYTDRCLAAMAAQSEKRIAAINARYASDPDYKERLRSAALANWQDNEYIAKTLSGLRNAWSDEALRRKMSDLYSTDHYRKLFSDTATDRWMDLDYRSKIMLSFDAARLQYMSAVSKALWQDDGYRAKMVAAQSDPEYRNKLSESSKANWLDSDYRTNLIKLYGTVEYKKRMSDATRRLWLDPEYAAKVTKGFKSSQEDLLSSILDDFGIGYERQFMVGQWSFDFMVEHDGQRLLIEVQGDYWHSLPEQVKRDAAKATYVNRYYPEYMLYTIWEHDFLCPQRVLDIVSGWLGLSTPETVDYAVKDTSVRLADKEEATILFSKYHYMANAGRAGIDIGLYFDNKLIGCARYCSPTRDESTGRLGLSTGQLLELSRFVIHPSYQKKNAASRLLGCSIAMTAKIKPQVKCLLTFADRTFGHTGTIYRATNWLHDGTIRPDYFYINNTGHVMHKKTMWNHASKMKKTEAEHASELGYIKKYGRDKERFIYWL